MENRSNKTIVLDAYKYLIGQCNTAVADKYTGDNYIQHGPTLKDGKQGLAEMIELEG